MTNRKLPKFCADCIYHKCNVACILNKTKQCKNAKCILMNNHKQCFNKYCKNFKCWYNNILDSILE